MARLAASATLSFVVSDENYGGKPAEEKKETKRGTKKEERQSVRQTEGETVVIKRTTVEGHISKSVTPFWLRDGHHST